MIWHRENQPRETQGRANKAFHLTQRQPKHRRRVNSVLMAKTE
jgi:hypothetical protein